MASVHLLVLIHGMWGNPNHLSELARIIRKERGGSSATTELKVLVAEANRDDSTYDGIDWGGERVAKEVCSPLSQSSPLVDGNQVLDEVQKLKEDEKKVTHFSITGYSLGGLLARYVVGYGMSFAADFYHSPLTHRIVFFTSATSFLMFLQSISTPSSPHTLVSRNIHRCSLL
jgi:dienelactone hydrolase